MRVLVDISHPAHVHLFRHAIDRLRADGHEVGVVSREKDVTTDLLDAYDVSHVPISVKQSGAAALPREWLWRATRLLRVVRSFDPDVILSRLNPAATHVGRLLDVPNVVFHDTEAAGLVDRVTTPYAAVVCTPTEFDRDVGPTQRRYAGFHELAYLHPARFDRDPDRLREAGVEAGRPVRGRQARRHGRAPRRRKGGFPRPPFGRSSTGSGRTARCTSRARTRSRRNWPHTRRPLTQTRCTNCSRSPTCTSATPRPWRPRPASSGPPIRYDPLGAEMGNFAALDDYGLVVSTDEPDEAVDRALALAADDGAGARWRRRRQQLLAEKIDVTAYITEVVTEVGSR